MSPMMIVSIIGFIFIIKFDVHSTMRIYIRLYCCLCFDACHYQGPYVKRFIVTINCFSYKMGAMLPMKTKENVSFYFW